MTEVRYSVSQLASLAGVSVRTLRYYDQIGLLTPSREANGYRIYDAGQIRKLQYIMLLRSCGLSLADIDSVLSEVEVSLEEKLNDHLAQLQSQAEEIAQTISATKRVIAGLEEFGDMNDEERFEKLKQDSVAKFEEEFGQEARALYGEDAIDQANDRMLSMSKLAWDMKEELEQRVKDALVSAMETEDPESAESRMCAELHAQWIRVHWGDSGYSPEAHVQLAEGYLKDPRFAEYYDSSCGIGATQFLCDIIKANVK